MARTFPDALLVQARAVPLRAALEKLGYEIAVDRDYVPSKDVTSVRWIVSSPQGWSNELIVTGARWFDTRQGKGGGGSIDLVIHLENLSFVAAVKRLASTMGWKK